MTKLRARRESMIHFKLIIEKNYAKSKHTHINDKIYQVKRIKTTTLLFNCIVESMMITIFLIHYYRSNMIDI